VVIDDGLIGRHFEQLLYACAGIFALALVGMALGALHRAIYVRASGRTLFALRRAAFGHLLKVSPRNLAEMPVGDLVTRLDGDVAEVQRFGTDSVATLVSSVLSLCLVTAVMVGISWRLSLLIVALAPLQLLVRHIARPRIESSTRAVRHEAGRVSSFLIEILSGARAVQAAAAEAHELHRLEVLGEGYLTRVLNSQLVAYATGTAAALLGHLATAATFVVGGWYVIHGELTVGALVAFTAYLSRTAGSAASLAGLYTGYQRALVSLQRLQRIFELPVVSDTAHAITLPRDARGALEFEAVTVRLAREGRLLLDKVWLAIPAGKKIVLRGASGVGKTTISDLLSNRTAAGSY
jgi:ATP-binding cassette subfamily B protein